MVVLIIIHSLILLPSILASFPSFHPSIHPSFHPSIHSSILPCTHQFTHPSLHLCPSIHLFDHLSIQLPILVSHIDLFTRLLIHSLCLLIPLSFTHQYHLIHPSIYSLSTPQCTHATFQPLNHHPARCALFYSLSCSCTHVQHCA